MGNAKIIFIQRPYRLKDLEIIKMAKNNGLKVWVDYDDDLFSVPFSNPTYSIYGDKKTQNHITEILLLADHISVSTAHLGNIFGSIINHILGGVEKNSDQNIKINPVVRDNITVVPNAYDNERFETYRKYGLPKKRSKLGSWRGSGTHDKDLMIYTEEIAESIMIGNEHTLQFIGRPFWYTIERLSMVPGVQDTKILAVPGMDPILYMHHIYKSASEFAFVPLEDSVFNRSKSNIAYIEFSAHAGSPCLVPNWDEWQKPGAINYSDKKDFKEKMIGIMKGDFDLKRLANDSWEYVMSELRLSNVNNLRKKIIEKLLNS
jgi:hypothetical protein